MLVIAILDQKFLLELQQSFLYRFNTIIKYSLACGNEIQQWHHLNSLPSQTPIDIDPDGYTLGVIKTLAKLIVFPWRSVVPCQKDTRFCKSSCSDDRFQFDPLPDLQNRYIQRKRFRKKKLRVRQFLFSKLTLMPLTWDSRLGGTGR